MEFLLYHLALAYTVDQFWLHTPAGLQQPVIDDSSVYGDNYL